MRDGPTLRDQSDEALLARPVGQGGAAGVPRRTAQTTDLTVPADSPAFLAALTPHGEPRCPYVAASVWGTARCVLPEGHTGRHAYGPTEGEL